MAVDLIARALALQAQGGGSGFAEEVDLNSPEFVPEENKYYLQKDSGIEPAPIDWQAFVQDETMPETYTVHIDTSKEQDLLGFFNLVAGQSYPIAYFYFATPDNGNHGVAFNAAHCDASDTGSVDADILFFSTSIDGYPSQMIPIYSTLEFDFPLGDGVTQHVVQGFQSLDENNNVQIDAHVQMPLKYLEYSPDLTIWENFDWNGNFASWAEIEVPAYKDGLLYFYDGEVMNVVNGELNHDEIVAEVIPEGAADTDILSVKAKGLKMQCVELIEAGDIIDDIYVNTDLFGGADDITAAAAVGHSEQLDSRTNVKTLIDLTVSEYNESSGTTTITDVKIGILYSYLWIFRKERSESSWHSDILYKDPYTGSWAKSCAYGKYIYLLNRFTENNRTHAEPKVATITVNNVYGQDVWSEWMGKKQQFIIADRGTNQINAIRPTNGAQVLKSNGDKYRLIFHKSTKDGYINQSVYTQYTNSNIGDSLFFNTMLPKDTLIEILSRLYSFNSFYMQIDQSGYGTKYLIIGKSQSSNDYAIAECDESKTNIISKIYASAALDDYTFTYFGSASGTAFEAKWYSEKITFSASARLTDHSSSYSYITPEYGQLLTIDGGIWFDSTKEANAVWDELKLSDLKFDDEGIGMAKVALNISSRPPKYGTFTYHPSTDSIDSGFLKKISRLRSWEDSGARIIRMTIDGTNATDTNLNSVEILNPQLIVRQSDWPEYYVVLNSPIAYMDRDSVFQLGTCTFYAKYYQHGEIKCTVNCNGVDSEITIDSIKVAYESPFSV